MIQVEKNVPLSPYTTWKIGGPAEFLIKPRTVHDILEAYTFARQLSVPLTIIGRGSNILIADDGIPGVTLLLRENFATITLSCNKIHIHATAGVFLPRLASFACKNKLTGFEFLIGIPGTIGGGVAGNAGKGGPTGRSISDILVSISALNVNTGTISQIEAPQLEMAYRKTSIPEKNLLVLSAILRGTPVSNNKPIIAKQKEIIAKRRTKFPLNTPTTGSVFKTPKDGSPAAWYIDQAGLKGESVGGVQISKKHANWIENTASGTANDLITLIKETKERVFDRFGITLEEEINVLPKKPRKDTL